MPAVIHMQTYHRSGDLILLHTENCLHIPKPAQGDETAKTLITDKCAGVQSYTVTWNTGFKQDKF
jgi:hypothetical protein